MSIRNEIKAQIVCAGFTMQELVDRLADEYDWSDSVSNLSAKLQRESIRYKEVVELADVLGYDRRFGEAIRVGGCGPYGNALVSRYPIVEAETVLVPDPVRREGGSYETRCVLKAVLDTEEGRICVLVCHMGLEIEERESAVATLCRLIDETELPIVLMGDFNAQPDAAVLAPLRERLQDTDDVADAPGAPTYASYHPHMKIDYILYRGLRCCGARTVEEIVSDHFPIIARFERL